VVPETSYVIPYRVRGGREVAGQAVEFPRVAQYSKSAGRGGNSEVKSP
jgi:hypothetical protein